jgi:hypothetical protein
MKNIAFLWAVLAVSVGLAQDKPSMAGDWKLDIAQCEFGSRPQIGGSHRSQRYLADVFISCARC